MAPQPLAAFNYTLSNGAPPFASNDSSTVSTIVFGVLAVAASVVGIWQAYKAWSIWHEHHHPGAVTRNGSHPTVEFHGTQATDSVHHVSGSIALTDIAMPPSPRPVSVNTSGDTVLPVSNTGNQSLALLTTRESRAPATAQAAAHPAAHPSSPGRSAHTSEQGQGDTQLPVSSTMSGNPSVGRTADQTTGLGRYGSD